MSLFSITAKAAGWKAIISALKNSSEEAQFKVSNDGVQFYGAPQGNPFIVSMIWSKNNLNELTLDAEKIIGFRTDDIDKIFKRFCTDDVVTISQKEEGYISISSGNRSWDLRVIDSSMVRKFNEPKLPHTVLLSVNPTDLKNILADVAVFSKTAHFVASKKQIANNGEIKSDEPVVYLNSTDDSGKARSQFTPHTIIEITEDATAEYNLDYINDIVSAVYSLSSSVKISFSNQKPILFEFEIIDAGVLRYYLAGLAIQ